MSAILHHPPAAARQESPGLWTLAWRRLRQDRVGMVSLVIVAVFLVLMAASYTGLVASDWSREVGVSYANPSFMAGAENLEADAMARRSQKAKAPPVDLSDIDPLAPRYQEWQERAAKIAVTEPKRAETLPFGGDKWGRDVLKKTIKGSEVSIFVGGWRARCSPRSSAPCSARSPASSAGGSTTSSSGSTTSSPRSRTSC